MLPVAVARSSSGMLTKSQGEGAVFRGCPGHIQKHWQSSLHPSLPRVRCKRDHSMASNVMQQKGSFSMSGKRKYEAGKF